MSLNQLKEGAIFVADSHYAPWNPLFLDFLSALENKEIETSQLILMGDNFDLLFGSVAQTHSLNARAIALLNRLSRSIDIVYLEGNHDFRLKRLFPHVQIIGRENQPYIATFGHSKVALFHGDVHTAFGYGFYTALIRNRAILYLLNVINEIFGGIIINRLIASMKRKNHCAYISNFEEIARRHCDVSGDVDIVIEGHFHQNRSFDFETLHYINLGAFVCDGRYYRLRSFEDTVRLDEEFYVRGLL
jgi:UDP-2,3-diacylglucosamine hydrolase